ncbi:MAG: hypothetical protein KY475_00585 [Planctomycetes bacterium]|nr:hypothetical protein [Planctomycetota bacterium]
MPIFVPASFSLPFVGDRQQREAWRAWGRQNLQHGDLIFVMGENRMALGLVNVSKLSAEVAESEFSHVGVIAVEDREPVVYDITSEGALRRPFDRYVTDRRVWWIAVRRLHPSRQACIPAAVEFCRRVHLEDAEFDNAYRLDNRALYCAELVEVTFRGAGQPLSTPVRIRELPGYGNLSPATVRLIEATTPLSPDQEVYLPGNNRFGIWSCSWLTTVLEKTEADSPPPLSQIARLPP